MEGIYCYGIFSISSSIKFVLIIRAKHCISRADSIYCNWKGERKLRLMATTNISIRMDSDLKAQADALFGELGMNLSTAFNIFVRQSLRDGGSF